MAQPSQVTLDIDEEVPPEGIPRNNVYYNHDLVPRPVHANRNNLGFGDRLNSVFREIRPLVENARMVHYLLYYTKTVYKWTTQGVTYFCTLTNLKRLISYQTLILTFHTDYRMWKCINRGLAKHKDTLKTLFGSEVCQFVMQFNTISH